MEQDAVECHEGREHPEQFEQRKQVLPAGAAFEEGGDDWNESFQIRERVNAPLLQGMTEPLAIPNGAIQRGSKMRLVYLTAPAGCPHA